ncbi:MAG TPA: GNAT family N-acetyltransferase [Chloroflexota bacterium]|nr:GNAT family N-acetyltransferase [Chloroflexota bacterium]
MPDAALLRLQRYLYDTAFASYATVTIGPFTAFFHPENPLRFLNYAIPAIPKPAGAETTLPRVIDEFRRRDRLPRFEFIEGYAPDLAPELQRFGFLVEGRLHLMTAEPANLAARSAVPGLQVVRLTEESPGDLIAAYRSVGARGFGTGDESDPAPETIEGTRRSIARGMGALLATLDGQPAGVGSFTQPRDGLSEVAGIATLPEFRRRGIAGAVTAEALRMLFEEGVTLAMLTAADERAGRVYERVGFRPRTTMLHMAMPE